MSLSSLIVQREVATIREVEEALARQVLYGGDLVTNLLEVGRVDETALLALVAESFGLPPASPGELPPPTPEAKMVVVAEVAVERALAPLAVDRYGLVVAVAEPLSKEAEQELTFALALPIEQKIAPLVRIKQALARDYGLPLERRFVRLVARLLGERTGMSSLPPPHITAPEMKAIPRPPSIPAEARPPKEPSVAPPPPPGSIRTVLREGDVEPPRASKRRRGPLAAEVARVELEESGERDTIFDLVFEFARQYFDYTALFVVHGDVAEGRDAFGDGISRDKIVRIGVPLDLPSILGKARETKELVRGIPSKEGIDPVVLADLGRSGKTECFVVPIVVRTRVVAMIFGDAGTPGIDEMSVTDVVSIASAASAAFERLIVRRKLKGTRPPPGTGATEPPQSPVEGPLTKMSAQPAVEELAPPIRDLMVEPVSRIAETTRAPVAEGTFPVSRVPPSPPDGRPMSERPPPPNILGVRRPSGPPIPREEPESHDVQLVNAQLHPPAAHPPPSHLAPPSAPRSGPPKSRSGQHRRAEAPPLDFGAKPPASILGGGFATDDVERRLLAEIEGKALPSSKSDSKRVESGPATARDTSPPEFGSKPPSAELEPASAFDPPPSPKAVSPPPMRAVAKTDLSPVAIAFPQPVAPMPTVIIEESPPPAHAAMHERNDPDKTPITPFLEEDFARPGSVVDVDDENVEVHALPPSVPQLVVSPSEPPPRQPFLETSSSRDVTAGVSAAPPSPPDTTRHAMPISEQSISVAAHRPPSARSDISRILPSVIVDVASEYVALVDRVIAGPDEEAEAELIRAGGHAMPAIMAQFPGPVTVEKDRLASGPLPRVADCGPVLRLVASQRRTALPFVLAHVHDSDADRRFWATYLLSELVYIESVDPTVQRLFDDDPRIRRAARATARALAEGWPTAVIERIGAIASDPAAPAARRVLAIEALGETRSRLAVPVVIKLLDAPGIADAARAALATISRQDFGTDAVRWRSWWTKNEGRHRIEWLIDALMHDSAAIRAAASEELKTLTKEYFGYYEDLPKRERERAQSRYREWWNGVGRIRFSRAASSRG
jgi:hypothetical protein